MISKDLISSFFNYFVRLILKPLVMLGIPLFLTESSQGYWYTFISVAALTTFADLGITSIITQFAAHEGVGVELMEIDAEDEKLYKLKSLYSFILKWIKTVSGIASIVIFLIGCFVFYKEKNVGLWMLPWLLYCFSSVFNFAIQVFLGFLEGCGFLADVQKIKAVDALVFNGLSLIFLMINFDIYALGIAMTVACVVDGILIKKRFRSTIIKLKGKTKEEYPWMQEILPLLGRYAVSWISGYIIFQIYNPLIFRMYGSAMAGKVGYAITFISSISSFANLFIYVAIPKMNGLAEEKKWHEMDRELEKRLPITLLFFTLACIAFNVLIKIEFVANILGDRLVTGSMLMMLECAYALQLLINGLAVYLRAHKKEPLMQISVVNAVISFALTISFLSLFGYDFTFLGYLITMVLSTPIIVVIFIRCRKRWHSCA